MQKAHDLRVALKLLRVLQEREFERVGGGSSIKVDIRVLAATNRDLLLAVREKKFREDLYYRLSVFELVIPPLRDRGSDIALLIDFFLDHFRHQHGRPGLELSEGARAKLLAYQWPGNVRQLRNVIDSAVVLAMANHIDEQDLGLQDAGTTGELDSLRIDVWEQRLIVEALKHGLPIMDKRWRGRFIPEATLVGPESRGSAPVRIPRDDNRETPGIDGLYPVGEGAGYAGGIVSAAVDGLRTAKAIMTNYAPLETPHRG